MEKVKADALIEDTKTTEFEYLKAKVEVLQEAVELQSKILDQHDLTLSTKSSPVEDIEDATWKRIEGDD